MKCIILELITEWNWKSPKTLLLTLMFQSHFVINSTIITALKMFRFQESCVRTNIEQYLFNYHCATIITQSLFKIQISTIEL